MGRILLALSGLGMFVAPRCRRRDPGRVRRLSGKVPQAVTMLSILQLNCMDMFEIYEGPQEKAIGT